MSQQQQASDNHKHWDCLGAICISTKGLDIVWGEDSRYWKQVQIPKDDGTELNYGEGMELLRVCWLEIRGTLNLEETHLLPNMTYKLFYIIKFKVGAFGWDEGPVPLHLVTPDGHQIKRNDNFGIYLKNKWHKVFGGEFTVGSTRKGNVRFAINGFNTSCWKGGMVLHGVLIEPKK
ncbi:protein PHLOEM PROTEIN 2-LIKE A5-like [Dioscorea cayenensis subsp. rotundata]|uniref:Protein PHLOEM PROTEIN 2-LIKE A5-like n=1 Tax=Dioscorea cayennensis subsp. rotundata TaxID=55577 RepID=A0AB40BJM8_DIOCR|nr:protein PHLOEM PROTEIN 2-LIKE A5-like [Dioscorea cayenensis subsp. rotundata]